MDDLDDVDVLLKYEILGRQRSLRRGRVRGIFSAFTRSPTAPPSEPSLQQQLFRQQAEQTARSVPVAAPQDRMTELREREQVRLAAQNYFRRSRT